MYQGIVLLKLKSSFWKFHYCHHALLNHYGIFLQKKWSQICSVFVVLPIRSFPHSWFINGCVTKVTRRMLLVEQKMFTLPEHLSSCPDLSHVRVAQSFIFYVVFCRSMFVLLFTFWWPLYCLSFNLPLLITLLVSLNLFHSMVFRFSSSLCIFNISLLLTESCRMSLHG